MKLNARGLRVLTISAGLLAGTALSAEAQVELSFWDQVWGPPEYAAAAQKLVDEFNASQSEIHVNYRSMSWSNWYETYVTAIASGSAPDISTGGGFQAVQFFAMDAIYPMDELVAQMKEDGRYDDFAPGTMEAMKYDGHYTALPFGIDVRVMHYRKDILARDGVAVPTNWDEFRAAMKATTRDGVFGMASSGDPSGMHFSLVAMINNGGGLFDADRHAALTSPRSMEGLAFLHDLYADGSISPASAGYTNDDARTAFYQGRSAFYLGSPSTVSGAGDARDEIGIVPPMSGPHGDKGTVYWVNNTMIYKQSQHPEEAIKFLSWWSDHQKPIWVDGHAGNLPARLSIQADPFFQSVPQVKEAIDMYVPVAKTMAATSTGTFPQLNEIDGDGFLISMTQRLWQGTDAAEAVKPAQAHLEEIMAK